MNANQIINSLTFAEANSKYAGDTRRMMRVERESLQVAVQSGDASKIKEAAAEAERVAKMWGVEI